MCPENCIETALKLFQGWATVKQSFLNFIEGRSPVEGNGNADPDVEAVVFNPLIQKPMDFLSRLKVLKKISHGCSFCSPVDANLIFDYLMTAGMP